MDGKGFVSQQGLTASLLILSALLFLPGGILYTGRAIWKWPVGQTAAYLRWERGFVIAAAVSAVLGLTLLDRLLEQAGDQTLGPVGLALVLIAAALVVVAETSFLSQQEWLYAPSPCLSSCLSWGRRRSGRRCCGPASCRRGSGG